MALTQAQLQRFKDDGVLIAPGVLSEPDLLPLQREYSDLIDRRAAQLQAQGKLTNTYAGESFERRIACLFAQSPEIVEGLDLMHARLPAAFEFLHNQNLLDAVEQLLGSGELTCSPIQHLRAKVPSGLGKGNYEVVNWHQDSMVTWEEADCADILTCWIPLVNATRQLGCMEVVPELWRQGYLEHVNLKGVGSSIRPDLIPAERVVCAECPRGGVVFMNKLTPHRGLPNLSNQVRWTIDLRYQRTGTPTGRPFHPDFPVRSKLKPQSVTRDYRQWCQRWEQALESSKGVHWHRIRPTPENEYVPTAVAAGQVQR